MAQLLCKIKLDVAESGSGVCVMAKQGDSLSRSLQIRLTKHGEPFDVPEESVVLITAKREDDEVRAFEGETSADGTFTVPLAAWMLENAGLVGCDVTVVGADGARLSSTKFSVAVESAVGSPEETVNTADDPDVWSRYLASLRVFTLTPTVDHDTFMLSPAAGNRYLLNLTDAQYHPNGVWEPFGLALPTVSGADGYEDIEISCHAPVFTGSTLALNWGDVLFEGGEAPRITEENFVIRCHFAAVSGKWEVALTQYAAAREIPAEAERILALIAAHNASPAAHADIRTALAAKVPKQSTSDSSYHIYMEKANAAVPFSNSTTVPTPNASNGTIVRRRPNDDANGLTGTFDMSVTPTKDNNVTNKKYVDQQMSDHNASGMAHPSIRARLVDGLANPTACYAGGEQINSASVIGTVKKDGALTNTADGRGAVALGRSNHANGTYALVAGAWNTAGRESELNYSSVGGQFVAGGNNRADGLRQHVTGEGNKAYITAHHAHVAGEDNTVGENTDPATVTNYDETYTDEKAYAHLGAFSDVGGSNNTVLGNYATVRGTGNACTRTAEHTVMLGVNNSTNAPYAVVGGSGNRVAESAQYSLVGGSGNVVNAPRATVVGQSCTAETAATNTILGGYGNKAKHQNTFVQGYDLETTTNNQTVVGRWNNKNTTPLFVVGAGASSGNRQNGLEVYLDGTVRAPKAPTPTNAKDLTTKEYVDSGVNGKLDKLSNTTGTPYVCAVNENDQQAWYMLAKDAVRNSVARRDTDGTLKVGTPTNSDHAATKAYVDAACGKVYTASAVRTEMINGAPYLVPDIDHNAYSTFYGQGYGKIVYRHPTENRAFEWPILAYYEDENLNGSDEINVNFAVMTLYRTDLGSVSGGTFAPAFYRFDLAGT